MEWLFSDLDASETGREDGFIEWKAQTALRRERLKGGRMSGQG